MDCLFCKIGSGEIESYTIYENDSIRAFLDVNPLTLGHTVVIPKSHAGNILELQDDIVEPVFMAVKHVTKMLQDNFSPEGFTIGINHGKISGQSVDHLHVHIIPRYKDDGGGSMHSIVSQPPKEDLQETHKKITT